MVANPPLDLELRPLRGEARSVREWITMFDLVLVVLDPFTNESAWLLRTSARVLQVYDQADCRVAWLVAATPEECTQFLGPYATELVTFADPDRVAIRALELETLPALVHIGPNGEVVGAAEGWDPPAWRAVTEELSRRMSWSRPVIPGPADPAPYAGTPAV